ncbi:MAG TPA: Hsp20/alpha crystallin family protein [Prolixibacteraceae bacterium]|nr:Hsp20/alpha crystallin family protein [Prolixibacteraceae bacterium]
MTLVRRSNSYYPSIPSFFDKIFNEDLVDWNNRNFSTTNTTVPAVNVKEDNEKYEIEVATPGLNKDDFKIKLENNTLTICSETKKEENEEKGAYTRKEFSYQSFQRSFSLPEGHVLTNEITAKYNDGILNIVLPKREEVKPQAPKEITIA